MYPHEARHPETPQVTELHELLMTFDSTVETCITLLATEYKERDLEAPCVGVEDCLVEVDSKSVGGWVSGRRKLAVNKLWIR